MSIVNFWKKLNNHIYVIIIIIFLMKWIGILNNLNYFERMYFILILINKSLTYVSI